MVAAVQQDLPADQVGPDHPLEPGLVGVHGIGGAQKNHGGQKCQGAEDAKTQGAWGPAAPEQKQHQYQCRQQFEGGGQAQQDAGCVFPLPLDQDHRTQDGGQGKGIGLAVHQIGLDQAKGYRHQ